VRSRCAGNSRIMAFEYLHGTGAHEVKKISLSVSLLALRAIPLLVTILAPAYVFGQGMPAPTPSSAGEKTAAQPGIEISIPLRDAKDAMVVYLPSNYTAEAKWPVIFWYHGIEGGPSTDFVKRHTAAGIL